MHPGLETNQILLLAILAVTIVLLFGEWIRVDLVAVLVILALSISGILPPEAALSGFSSEPAILVAVVFVLGGALYYTGLSERFGTWIKRLAVRNFDRIIGITMPTVALLSAFTHHVTVTAIMLPVVLNIARENKIPASRLLMPMSFAASLGTTIVIIGAPAFLLANGLLRQAGHAGLSIFSIAPIGLALCLAGTLFFLLFGRFLLPEREDVGDASQHFRLDGYFTELVLLPDSPILGKTVDDLETSEEQEIKVVSWFRNGRPRNKPFGQKRMKAGDVLLVRIHPDKLASIQKERGVELQPLHKYGDGAQFQNHEEEDAPSQLVQAVIAPQSDLIGRTIGSINFIQNYGVIVVSVWRKKGWLRTELSRTRIREGDILVMVGDAASLKRIAENSSFLMLAPFHGEEKPLRKAPLAGAIMLLSILAATLNLVPVVIALMAGAAAMVLGGCMTMRQAYQSINTRIFVFIAGAIPLGLAMQETGTAGLLAGWLQGVVMDWEIHWVLLVFFITAGIITQILSDSATVALLGPIAIALARSLQTAPEPYIITVAMAAVTSFVTPIGHHGNLLIYGAGNYKFSDFLRVGTPLTLIVAIIVILLAPMLWPS